VKDSVTSACLCQALVEREAGKNLEVGGKAQPSWIEMLQMREFPPPGIIFLIGLNFYHKHHY
jgi:hypothetical protein